MSRFADYFGEAVSDIRTRLLTEGWFQRYSGGLDRFQPGGRDSNLGWGHADKTPEHGPSQDRDQDHGQDRDR